MQLDLSLRPPNYPGGRHNVAPSGELVTLETDLVVLALGYRNEPLPQVPAFVTRPTPERKFTLIKLL